MDKAQLNEISDPNHLINAEGFMEAVKKIGVPGGGLLVMTYNGSLSDMDSLYKKSKNATEKGQIKEAEKFWRQSGHKDIEGADSTCIHVSVFGDYRNPIFKFRNLLKNKAKEFGGELKKNDVPSEMIHNNEDSMLPKYGELFRINFK